MAIIARQVRAKITTGETMTTVKSARSRQLPSLTVKYVIIHAPTRISYALQIEDLEITNRSLMAINASLEKTKNKQAKEIRELRRKLRESRLILPPHTYRAVKSSLDHDDTADDDDDDGEDDDDAEETDETDDVFVRIKAIVENLLESGRRALETKVADFGGVGSAAKVLSAEEARSWRRNSLVDDDHELDQPPSPSRIAVPDSDDDTPLDDEDMISSSPPIFITPSP